MNKSDQIYGYKHWTLEINSRCFYVGKGNKFRPYSKRRNHKWKAIVKRYGLRVEVVTGPVTNEKACSWEIENIRLMNTFSENHSHCEDDIGCNFTLGGEGVPGWHHKERTRVKLAWVNVWANYIQCLESVILANQNY